MEAIGRHVVAVYTHVRLPRAFTYDANLEYWGRELSGVSNIRALFYRRALDAWFVDKRVFVELSCRERTWSFEMTRTAF